ncbi:TetR/AcrR family transcriptional regulator [Dactylosporangium sp. NPDC048998]|uniref:TetR/AcrR family transcriptional regulator n=1 Tax=Dactylosporangium sp. NPDC048998 TaxID=3363976 RepID=UPI00371C5BDF
MLYGAPTPQRRDAQRNRSAIVRAASELMLSRRSAVLTPEIARRAGVGHATLYRHFRDRRALVAAVVADQLERLESYVAANAERPAAFRHLLGEVLRTQVAMRPLVQLIGGGGGRGDRETRRRYTHRVVATLAAPLRRAQADGQVRPDLSPDDLALLFAMLSGAVEAAEHAVTPAATAAERAITLLLDAVLGPPATS